MQTVRSQMGISHVEYYGLLKSFISIRSFWAPFEMTGQTIWAIIECRITKWSESFCNWIVWIFGSAPSPEIAYTRDLNTARAKFIQDKLGMLAVSPASGMHTDTCGSRQNGRLITGIRQIVPSALESFVDTNEGWKMTGIKCCCFKAAYTLLAWTRVFLVSVGN